VGKLLVVIMQVVMGDTSFSAPQATGFDQRGEAHAEVSLLLSLSISNTLHSGVYREDGAGEQDAGAWQTQ
jgi:hypothetical protein